MCTYVWRCTHSFTDTHAHAQAISAKAFYTSSEPTYILLLYVYISVLSEIAAQIQTCGVFRVARLRLNWLCLWVCISLDPSSGSSAAPLMMRLVFVWTELLREKNGGADSEKVKAKQDYGGDVRPKHKFLNKYVVLRRKKPLFEKKLPKGS